MSFILGKNVTGLLTSFDGGSRELVVDKKTRFRDTIGGTSGIG
jgi:hypothetical protein